MTGIETAAAVAAVAAAAVSAYATYEAGQSQKEAQDYNAKLARNQAIATEQAGQLRERQERRQARQLIGRQEALYGASGVDLASGSPLLVMADTAREVELSIIHNRWNTEQQAINLRAGGKLLQFQGSQAARAGTLGATSSLLGGLSAAGSGYARLNRPGSYLGPTTSSMNAGGL